MSAGGRIETAHLIGDGDREPRDPFAVEAERVRPERAAADRIIFELARRRIEGRDRSAERGSDVEAAIRSVLQAVHAVTRLVHADRDRQTHRGEIAAERDAHRRDRHRLRPVGDGIGDEDRVAVHQVETPVLRIDLAVVRDYRSRQFPLRDLRAQHLGRDVGALLDDVGFAVESLGQELDVRGQRLGIAAADEAQHALDRRLPVLDRRGLARAFVTDLMAAQAIVLEVLPLLLALELQAFELRARREAVGQLVGRGEAPHLEGRFGRARGEQVNHLLRIAEARRARTQRQVSLERGVEMKASFVIAVDGLRIEAVGPNECDQRSADRRVDVVEDLPIDAGRENRLCREQRAGDEHGVNRVSDHIRLPREGWFSRRVLVSAAYSAVRIRNPKPPFRASVSAVSELCQWATLAKVDATACSASPQAAA